MAEFDVEYDLVVCGSGAAGKSAALIAARAGQKVVILEKMDQTGGSSVYAEGTGAFESIEQKERKVPANPKYHFPTKQEAYDNYMEWTHDRANADVARAFVDNAWETISIYRELGVEYMTVCTAEFGKVPEVAKDMWSFHITDGFGAHLQEVLLDAVQKEGVDIFCSTPAKELIVEDGKVVGVLAESEGDPLRVGGKAVILATGGCGDSPELIEKYSWCYPSARRMNKYTNLENVGDGLRMALSVGADPHNITLVPTLGPSGLGKGLDSQSGGAAVQPEVWVNRKGKRFVAESKAESVMELGGVFGKQPDGVTWSIMSAEEVDRLAKNGPDFGLGFFVPYGKPMSTLWTELNQDVEDGLAFKADTLGELAEKIGVDKEAFLQTMADYNKACDGGYDPVCEKKPQYLRPLKNGPFYAIGITVGTMGCSGGVKVNGNMQVVDEHYDPIPGLYAAGWDADGLWGDTYDHLVPGSGNGFAHTSGRIAARHFLSTLER